MDTPIYFAIPKDNAPAVIELATMTDTAGTFFSVNGNSTFSPSTGEKLERVDERASRIDIAFAKRSMVQIGECGKCNCTQHAHFEDVTNLIGSDTASLHCVACGTEYDVDISTLEYMSADTEIEAKDIAMGDYEDEDTEDTTEGVSELDSEIMSEDEPVEENDGENSDEENSEDEENADDVPNEDVTDGDAEELIDGEELDEDAEEEEDDEDSEEIDESAENADWSNFEDVTSEFDDEASADDAEEELITDDLPEIDEASLAEALKDIKDGGDADAKDIANEEAEANVEKTPVETANAEDIPPVESAPAPEVSVIAGDAAGDTAHVTLLDANIVRDNAKIECVIDENSTKYFVFANGMPVGLLNRDKAHSDNASVFDKPAFVKGFTVQYRSNRDVSRFGYTPYAVKTDVSALVENAMDTKRKEITDTASADAADRLEGIRKSLGVVALAANKGITDNPLRTKLIQSLDAAGFEGADALINRVLRDTATDYVSGILNEAIVLADKPVAAREEYSRIVEKANYAVSTGSDLASGGRLVPDPAVKRVISDSPRDTASVQPENGSKKVSWSKELAKLA